MTDASDEHAPALGCKAVQVLDAARWLFIEQGFEATSMDAIATDAGVSKATIYAHYSNKQALFAATARRECRRVTAQMALPDDLEGLPLARALERIARGFLAAVFRPANVALLRMVIAESVRFPEIGEIFHASAPAVTQANLAAFLKRVSAHGLIEVSDCDLAAAQFLGSLRGDVHLRALLDLPVAQSELDALAAESVRAFMAAYQPRRPN